MLRHALILLAVVCTAGESPFLLRPDRADGVYPAGATVRIAVTNRDGSALPADGASITLQLNNRSPVAATVTTAGNGLELTLANAQPGWYVCHAERAGVKDAGLAGVVVAPETFQPARSDPTGLQAIWDSRRAALAAAPAAPILRPLTDAQRSREADGSALEAAGCQRFDVEIPALGDWAPMRGYLALPPQPASGKQPAILLLHAAGVDGHWCLARSVGAMQYAKDYGAIVLDINAHGLANGLDKADYTAESNGRLKNYGSIGREDAERWYFVGMYLRLMRATAFLAGRPEWDGKHLVTIGESQGAGQALAAAALDPRVSAVIATVPALCDISGPTIADRPWAWPMVFAGVEDAAQKERIATAIPSCDNVHLAPWSHAESLVVVGLLDTTCPPTSVIATWNRLPQPKRLITYPHRPHQENSKDDQSLGNVEELRRAFLRQHLTKAP